jgi:DNA-binding beta-propeller fold protein YncE
MTLELTDFGNAVYPPYDCGFAWMNNLIFLSGNGLRYVSKTAQGCYDLDLKNLPNQERIYLSQPQGLATDPQGNIYVADTQTHSIRKIDGRTFYIVTYAGKPASPGFADGVGEQARFNNPIDVAVDLNRFLYVLDAGNGKIRVISPTGNTTTLTGIPLETPTHIAVDRQGKYLYVMDKGLGEVLKVTLNR